MAVTTQGYWLVYPKSRKRSAKIQAFRDWVLSEIAGDAERTAETAQRKTGASAPVA
jgi:LysR family glycine cleavage system transcriptional activator